MKKKNAGSLQIRNSTAEFLIFTAPAGENSIEVRYEDEAIWLTQKLIAALFDVDVRTVSEHLKNIFKSGELQENSVIRKFRNTAADDKSYQNLCDAGLVSPIYTVFKNTDAVEDAYLFRVLKSPLLVHLYRVNTSSSVDRRGSLRYDEFAGIHIWIPGKDEQRSISNVLDTCDEELRLLRALRAAHDQQKRGLMQRLLTGKVRVK